MTPIAFLHMPKTAGTSIRVALQEHFGPESCYTLGLTEDWKQFRANAASLKEVPFISGHFNMADLDLIPGERRTFTVLRNPVDRIVSWHGFLRRRSNVALHEWAMDGGFHSFIEKCNTARRAGDTTSPEGANSVELYNGMCRRLHPDATAEAALSVIRERNILVLDQADMEHGMRQLSEWLGIVLPLPRTNVSSAKPAHDASVYARIAQLNAEDEKLYKALCVTTTSKSGAIA